MTIKPVSRSFFVKKVRKRSLEKSARAHFALKHAHMIIKIPALNMICRQEDSKWAEILEKCQKSPKKWKGCRESQKSRQFSNMHLKLKIV